MRFRWPMHPTELLLTLTGDACKCENILTAFKGTSLFGHSCTWPTWAQGRGNFIPSI